LADDRYHLAFASHEPTTDTRIGVTYHRNSTDERIAMKAVRADNGDWIVNGTKELRP